MIEKAEKYRDSRISVEAVTNPDSLTDDTLRTITVDDITPAIHTACDERHITITDG